MEILAAHRLQASDPNFDALVSEATKHFKAKPSKVESDYIVIPIKGIGDVDIFYSRGQVYLELNVDPTPGSDRVHGGVGKGETFKAALAALQKKLDSNATSVQKDVQTYRQELKNVEDALARYEQIKKIL